MQFQEEQEVPNPNEADLPINFELDTNFITIKQENPSILRQTLDP